VGISENYDGGVLISAYQNTTIIILGYAHVV